MDFTTYEAENNIEKTHWWFVGRGFLFSKILERFKIHSDSFVLDLGTSTGTNLRMLQEQGIQQYLGVDLSLTAIHYCRKKGLQPIICADICALPFPDNYFDFVFATDIVEHVEEDLAALSEIQRVLKPNGHALITVPAFQSLWGPQDNVSNHKRRYCRAEFLEKLKKSRFVVDQNYYFNYILFLPIFFMRKILNLMNIQLKSENNINTSFLNWVLTKIFRFDVKTARTLSPPFGVSLLALVRKKA